MNDSILQQNELNVNHVHHKLLQFYPNFPSYISMLFHNHFDYEQLRPENLLNDLVYELRPIIKFYLD